MHLGLLSFIGSSITQESIRRKITVIKRPQSSQTRHGDALSEQIDGRRSLLTR